MNRKIYDDIINECIALSERKGHDYGDDQVDNIAMVGMRGIAIRNFDKATRLLSLTRPGMIAKVKDETVRDTLIDGINYNAYGVMLLDDTWNQYRHSHTNEVPIGDPLEEDEDEDTIPEFRGAGENPKVYACHSMSLTAEVVKYYKKFGSQFVFIPGQHNPFNALANGDVNYNDILAVNFKAINQCDAVEVHWNGCSFGTIMDIGYALAQDKPIIVAYLELPVGRPTQMHNFIRSLPTSLPRKAGSLAKTSSR